MSPDFIPLRPSAGVAGSAGSSASTAAARRAAKAVREFQAILLQEMMKPLTEPLASDPMSQDESGLTGTGLNRDLYSWYWSEALAGQLAGRWPLPALPGIEAAAPSASASVARRLMPARTEAPSLPGNATTGGRAITPSASGDRPISLVTPVTAGRSASGPPEAQAAAAPGTGHQSLLSRAGRLFKLPVNLLRAVMLVESGGKEDAISSQGAVGLMQLMPETAREMGIRDPKDPWENVYAGAKYLSRQVARFDSLEKAVAAYNAGPSAVETHQGVPPFPETRAYVQRVLDTKARLDLLRPEDA